MITEISPVLRIPFKKENFDNNGNKFKLIVISKTLFLRDGIDNNVSELYIRLWSAIRQGLAVAIVIQSHSQGLSKG